MTDTTITPELPFEPKGGFDWLNDNSVVLREQPETAVYFNADGALVIRQRAAWNQDDDPFARQANRHLWRALSRARVNRRRCNTSETEA
jgi:hypothetical protein